MASDLHLRELESLTPLFQAAAEDHRVFKDQWTRGSKRLGVKAYKESEEYGALLSRFRASQRRLEEAIEPALESLRAGRKEGVDRALAYLSIRLRPHRSGYTSAAISRALKHVPLEERQIRLLREIILDRVSWPWASVRDLWRWIPRLRTPEFETALRDLAEHKVPWIARRAARLTREHL